MSTFPEAFAAWEAAQREAAAVPSAETRITAEQARWALSHHPAAHKARSQLDHAEARRRQGSKQ